jgi:uncharacterized protein YggT (Ycf19 family)
MPLVFFNSIIFFIRLLEFLLTVRVILSCVTLASSVSSSRCLKFVYEMTEPMLYPIRVMLNKILHINVMIDFSPLIVYCIFELAKQFTVYLFKSFL